MEPEPSDSESFRQRPVEDQVLAAIRQRIAAMMDVEDLGASPRLVT